MIAQLIIYSMYKYLILSILIIYSIYKYLVKSYEINKIDWKDAENRI